MSIINADEIRAQVQHWLETPAYTYLGSSYGCNIKDFLQSPIEQIDADALITKLKIDVPIVSGLDIDFYSATNGIDTIGYFLDVGGVLVDVSEQS